MNKETIYWGVLCRKCSEPVAFGSPSHQQFELGSAYARPGAIRCTNGHNHIYFPRDFKFFASAEEISDAAMRGNREAHRVNNPVMVAPSDKLYGTRWVPEKEPESSFPDLPNGAKATPASTGLDPRRETAQTAAKDWWAKWGNKKVS
jgi:hypothetical protein